MTGSDAAERPTIRHRLSAAARREMILSAALEVFAEHGLEGGRLRQVAARAGISEPYLFRHFASKAELYECAVIQPLIELVERFEKALGVISEGPTITVADLIREINRLILEFMLEAVPYVGVSLFASATSGNELYGDVRPRVVDPVLGLLRRIKGWPAPTVSLELVANSMWGINYGVALDSLQTGFKVDVVKTSERISRLYLLGVPAFHSQTTSASGTAR
jgi:TetR/AcrR family transcriptional regulator